MTQLCFKLVLSDSKTCVLLHELFPLNLQTLLTWNTPWFQFMWLPISEYFSVTSRSNLLLLLSLSSFFSAPVSQPSKGFRVLFVPGAQKLREPLNSPLNQTLHTQWIIKCRVVLACCGIWNEIGELGSQDEDNKKGFQTNKTWGNLLPTGLHYKKGKSKFFEWMMPNGNSNL